MHATIQKPIEEIVDYIKTGEKVFVVGCNNCAWKCHSGGEDETQNMAKRKTWPNAWRKEGSRLPVTVHPDPRECLYVNWTIPEKC